ncbi:DUF5000 domain-containing lipoprotein [Sphingobacterium sp. CZ-UAM]|uniref:DUF5000 domain-containing lipoprotein n=1 Tax=Sphingobacterium sp. CZ-UAM TaxID=1933868 RepID=UPI00158F3059|nr:DUF5000 domain-containing lipoprotein [Sphingobacterium sp. CZ-UAM]
MKRIVQFILPTLAILFIWSCKESSWADPSVNDNSTPMPVEKAVVVENFSGGASIKFALPKSSNALYVQAEYDVGNGKIFKQKTSIYNDTIHVDGFVKAGGFDVQLYAVSRAEQKSTPITIKVNPTDPPFSYAAKTAQIRSDFGGILVQLDNPVKAALAAVILKKNTDGKWSAVKTDYSAEKQIVFNVRGMKAEETTFGLTIRDKYQNFSDTVEWTGIPELEEEIDKKKIVKLSGLPTDQGEDYGWAMERLWDGNLATGFHTKEYPPAGMPQWFTFDLGQEVSLSRFVINQRLDIYMYSHGNPREFELYGSIEQPLAADDKVDVWDPKWQSLGHYEVIKPSGQLPGINSAVDIDLAKKGHEFNFPPGTPKVRYIRFKVVSAWAAGFFHLMELTLYGQNEKK